MPSVNWGKRVFLTNWNIWLDELVFWDNYEYIPRRAAIGRFCRNGLIQFLQKHGYEVQINPKQLGARIATGLYKNRNKSILDSDWSSFGPIENNYNSEEYKDHYYHIVDSDRWDYFWSIWGIWSDVDLDEYRGWDRRMDIQDYIWTQLSLELSPQTQTINELLGIFYEDIVEDGDGRDVYLRDMAESNEWGGIRR